MSTASPTATHIHWSPGPGPIKPIGLHNPSHRLEERFRNVYCVQDDPPGFSTLKVNGCVGWTLAAESTEDSAGWPGTRVVRENVGNDASDFNAGCEVPPRRAKFACTRRSLGARAVLAIDVRPGTANEAASAVTSGGEHHDSLEYVCAAIVRPRSYVARLHGRRSCSTSSMAYKKGRPGHQGARSYQHLAWPPLTPTTP
ncbi:MAG: hypothetical protein M1823_004875 [Watsoniomyces obsoletus]|nr:MAG: hypothetical protein M1823_004875 [Watsoniomyces obsoletus]